MTDTLTEKLLDRGDYVAFEEGRIVIRPKSGKPVPSDWIKKNSIPISREVLKAADLDALQYVSYSTGYYTHHKTGGVTLQYISLLTGESFHLVFNAELTRARVERGQRLPRGKFRVGKGHSFTHFWLNLGLPLPARLSAFHDCMGKLKPIAITCSIGEKNRIIKGSIKPLEISHVELMTSFNTHELPDNYLTTFRQLPDNFLTKVPDKKSSETFSQKGLEENSSTCAKECVLSNQGSTGKGSNVIPLPIQQSNEEWLSDYEGGFQHSQNVDYSNSMN